MRIRWLLVALLLSALLAGVHITALLGALYWEYVWLDVPVHYLGGLVVGAFSVAFLWRFRPVSYAFLFALVVVGWEAFEYLFGIPRESNYAFDTALDLLVGTFGALTVYAVARFTVWR